MQDPMEVYMDDEAKANTIWSAEVLPQIKESEMNRKLFEPLDALELNQVVIFVKSIKGCMALGQLLEDENTPAIGNLL